MFNKRVSLILISACLVLGLSAPVFATGDIWTWGNITAKKQSVVAPETVHSEIHTETSAGKQVINTLEFNIKNENLKLRAGKSFGKVYGSQTVLGITNLIDEEFPGQVVCGINADFFDMGYGVPFGIFIEDGKLLSTPPQYSSAFGIKKDLTPFVLTHGTMMNKTLLLGEKKIPITGLNNRIKQTDAIMLYNSDFGATTHTSEGTYEIIAEVLSGEPRHGEEIVLKVESISETAGNTPIQEGKVVLSATGSEIEKLREIEVDSEFSVVFEFTEFWQDVEFAVGGNYTLVKDGQVQDVTDNARNPRTAIGYKEDGTLVFYTIDGRQSGYSAGSTLKETAQALCDMGCVGALNLDGGGSTTFVLRRAGYTARKVVNSPSGGSSRAVANAIVLVNTAPKKDNPTHLIVTPEKKVLLQGAQTQYKVSGAYDENIQPHEIKDKYDWAVDSSCAEVSEDGTVTAIYAGETKITAKDKKATGTANVKVVDTLTAITCTEKELSLNPKTEKEINVKVLSGNDEVVFTPDQLTWKVEGKIGEITNTGRFTASDRYATGNITVSYKDTKLVIPVTVNGEKVIEFDDISAHLWAKENIYSLAKQGIIRGVTETTFEPAKSIKRADFMLLIVRMMGIDTSKVPASNFADVPPGAYYYNELGTAKEMGIANGISQTEFAPERNITRQEMFTLVWRVMNKLGHISTEADVSKLTAFADNSNINDYAKQAIATMVELGFVKGDSKNCVNPKNPATRAEAAVFIDRVNMKINPDKYPDIELPPEEKTPPAEEIIPEEIPPSDTEPDENPFESEEFIYGE